mmetsp:Transcript_22623/g.21790  ORF Transcript_22623/g.21790 Transcript_22623/m.21790 type:complete len:90 (-) Transcript_22623:1360-1629(-)
MGRIEVVEHHFLILADLINHSEGEVLVLPHLQDVDDLPYVTASTFCDLVQELWVDLEPLHLGDVPDPVEDHLFRRPLELKVVAVVDQRS